VFPHPKWKLLIAASLILFTSVIVGSVATQTMTIPLHSGRQPEAIERRLTVLSVVIVWGGFVGGLLTLIVFALKNLFTL
jgi:hypothetical protein